METESKERKEIEKMIAEALKDWKVITILIFVFCGFAVTFYGMNDVGARIIKNQTEANKALVNYVKVRDTVLIKEVVHDTLLMPSIHSTYNPYTSAEVFEEGGSLFEISLSGRDIDMDFNRISSYKIMCNGVLVDRTKKGGVTFKDCSGKWVIEFQGERE